MSDLFHRAKLPSSLIDYDPGLKIEWLPNKSINGFDIFLPGASLSFSEKFFSVKICDRTFAYLQENLSEDWHNINWAEISEDEFNRLEFRNIRWKQDYLKFFGKTIPLPRLTAWYGDPGASYKYSGIHSDPNPWNKGLLYIKEHIEKATNAKFNSVLLNWYRDGSDSLSWHADDEKELGPEPTIASVSFGVSREFLFKEKGSKSTQLKFQLVTGSLLVMKGVTQENWVHSIPKRKRVLGSRFNLTFRYIE